MEGVLEEVLFRRIERRQVEGRRARIRHCCGSLDAIVRWAVQMKL